MLPGVDLEGLLVTVGYVGLFAIIFAESGLLFGFFLPGDSLLLTAGVISAAEPETFPIWLVCAVCFVAAVTGDAVGYWFGHRVGRKLYERPDSRLFRQSHLRAAEAFYEKHGGKTIVIARFLPFVRTFAPIVAGVGNMDARRFLLYSVAGAILWGGLLPIAGYLFGQALGDNIDRFLLPVILGIIALSLLPPVLQLLRANRERLPVRFGRRAPPG